MRRTKEWWARLTKEERSEIVYIERQQYKSYRGGGYLPDDCGECSVCGEVMFGTGLCTYCGHRYEELLSKADKS